MSVVTASLVKELREKSGAGMLECKKALEESQGSLDAALEYLRKQGLKASASKLARNATDGLVVSAISNNAAALIEINSETDFVAKNDELVNAANKMAQLVLEKKPASNEELLNLKLSDLTVNETLNALISKIGEKISLRRFTTLTAGANQKLGSYIHLGSKIGVLVLLAGPADDQLAKDVAMHIAAINPAYVKKSQIPASVLEKEKEICKEQMKDITNKPAEILEKILLGKVDKFASDICLENQLFIKDPSGKKTVSQFLKEKNKDIEVVQFIRYQVGEGMEKKQDDFASEVAKMLN